jgi:hypothetical protein
LVNLIIHPFSRAFHATHLRELFVVSQIRHDGTIRLTFFPAIGSAASVRSHAFAERLGVGRFEDLVAISSDLVAFFRMQTPPQFFDAVLRASRAERRRLHIRFSVDSLETPDDAELCGRSAPPRVVPISDLALALFDPTMAYLVADSILLDRLIHSAKAPLRCCWFGA